MKLFYFDLETTGVKHWRNGIHQISGCIEIEGEVKESFDYKVQPNPQCDIEDEALAIAGINRQTLDVYAHMSIVHRELTQMLSKYVDKYSKVDKFHLVGFNNAAFDNQFLRGFFAQNGDNYFGSWFWSSSIDVMVLAANHLKNDRHKMSDFKLKTVAQYLGIPIEESRLHDATYDIELTRAIYQAITF